MNFHEVKSYVEKAGTVIRETDDLIRNAELCEPSSPESEVALEKGILRLQLVYSNLRVIYLDIRKHWTAQDGNELCKKHLITKVLELMNRVRENTLHLEDTTEAVRGRQAFRAQQTLSGRRGRPKYTVLKKHLDILSSLNMTWVLISKIFGKFFSCFLLNRFV